MEKIILDNKGTFTIRSYRPEDEQNVLALWKTAFGKEMPISLWNWKYQQNPFGCHMLLCVNDADEPVVMYGGVPYQAQWNGKRVEITQLMDIMSHPDYRKTGLFIHTGNAFFDTFGGSKHSVMLYGFPGKYHFEIGQKYLAYQKMASDIAYLSADPAALSENKPSVSSGNIEQRFDIDASFDSLWKRCQVSYPFSVIRNADFLRWRFIDHPFNHYEIWGHRMKAEKDLAAYAILSFIDNKATLVDLLGLPFDSIWSDFWIKLGKMLAQRDISQLHTWLPDGHFITHAVMASGLKRFPEPIGIIPTVRSFDTSLTFDWISKNLYYTMADTDLM